MKSTALPTAMTMSYLTRTLWRTLLSRICPFLLMEVASLCPRRGCSLSAGSRATTATRGRCTRHGTWVHRQSKTMASLTLLLLLASPLLLHLFLLCARTRLLPSRLVAVIMAFFPLLTSQPIFLLILTSGGQDLPPGARVRLREGADI